MADRIHKIMSALKANEKKTGKVTLESDVWRRYVDYKDFPSVFDYRNEYNTSSRFIQSFDIGILKDSLRTFEKKAIDKLDNCDLEYHELMPPSVGSQKSNISNTENIDPFANSDDDDKDKDYDPGQDDILNSSSDSYNIIEKGGSNVVEQPCALENKTPDFLNQNHNIGRQSDTQHCEYVECKLNVFSTCAKCLCFLCWEHFDNTTSYNNCLNHMPFHTDQDLSKKSTKKKNKPVKTTVTCTEKVKELNQQDSIQHCEYAYCHNKITTCCIKCSCFLCADHFQILSDNCNNHKAYSSHKDGPELYITKRGKISKRKVFEKTLKERKQNMKEIKLKKFAMKDSCGSKCTKKCANNISQARRQQLHEEYSSLDWESHGIFIKGLVIVKQVQRRKYTQILNPKRKATYAYHFLSEDLERIPVCKKFFLSTLGFKPSNDRRVLSVLKKSVSDQKNKKGSYKRTQTIDKDFIKEHILKYNPTISHYRRKHAPNRLYLPSDISIKSMYEDFSSKYPDFKVSIEVYRNVVRKNLNISFANLGHEECESCSYFQEHDKNHLKNKDNKCNVCVAYMEHKIKYTTSRQEYQRDVQKAITNNDDTIYFSVDLQKVIMLPRMDQYKAAIFCPRIIAFNESFVPLGSDSKHLPIAVIWPETVSGRRQEDITSAYRAFFLFYRDATNIVLWADNCASQNKNWSLFTFLVYIINSNEIATQTITIKYFEPGHTFMSADSFHHQVELSLQRKKKVYDFNDFSDAIKSSNSNKNVVKEMHLTDFYNFKDESSQAKLKKVEPRLYLKDIMAVEARRGCFTLIVKKKHNEEHQQHSDFLKAKNISKRYIPEPTHKPKMKGISEATKNAIIQKLVPLMPENRRRFWCNLPVSESIDLDEDS